LALPSNFIPYLTPPSILLASTVKNHIQLVSFSAVGQRDICICAILKSGLRPFAIPQNGFSQMPLSNVNQPLQCLFLILLPILQFNQPELTKIPLGAC
jgi:hypothetical protein